MQALRYAQDLENRLIAAGFAQEEAQAMGRLVTAHLLGCEPNRLALMGWTELDPDQGEPLLQRILAGEPLQYVLGRTGFMGLEFRVEPGVLIPRFDSEPLVERAIQMLEQMAAPVIGDVCCGSGCLGISLAVHLPQSQVWLTDLSPAALKQTRQNAEQNQVLDRCHLCQGDLAQPLLEAGCHPDLLIANPPYIPSGELDTLSPQVQREPRLALDGGVDGLALYPRLIGQCRRLLSPGGLLILEHGDQQQDQVCQLLAEQGFFPGERLFDLGGRPRGVLARCVSSQVPGAVNVEQPESGPHPPAALAAALFGGEGDAPWEAGWPQQEQESDIPIPTWDQMFPDH